MALVAPFCAAWMTPSHAADPAGSGPEPAVVYSEGSLPTHTIYRPAVLAGRYPIVLWGNGSCVNSNFGYREFLAEVASHGFIVLAIGPHRDSPAPREQRPADPAQWPPFETRYSQMLEALDWIAAENARQGSPLLGKVAVDTYVVGGMTDHITPWHGVYRTAQLVAGKRATFVLSNGGHIQSLVNPPGNKRSWFMAGPSRAANGERWSARLAKNEGSWWPHWHAWLRARSGATKAAPQALGNARYPALDAAPGTYVVE